MAYFDEAKITVISGKGGDGCLSFRREKYIERGGPDGGDGGDGGDIILEIDLNLNSLSSFKGKRNFQAVSGKNGSGRNKKGKSGEDLVIRVPIGTQIYATQTKELIGEINESNSKIIVAKGGKGGLGNARFKSSTNQAPKKTTKGEHSDSREIFLEMRLIADIGLLGLPNAGKSTLINALTNSKSKVGNFPFTTLIPTLGVLENSEKSLTIADMPGIIEGASDGHGLGFKFLRHLHRTKFLLHLVDCSISADEALGSFSIIENELKEFHLDFSKQKRWVCLTKVDLLTDQKISNIVNQFSKRLKDIPLILISSKDGTGLEELKKELFKRL